MLNDKQGETQAPSDLKAKLNDVKRHVIKFLIRNKNSLIISIGLGVASYFVVQQCFASMSGANCFLISCLITLMLSVLFINCRTARCVGALLLPSLGSRVTKTVLMAAVSAVILLGPMRNVMHNVRRTTDSVTCYAELAVNKSAKAFGDVKQFAQLIDRTVRDHALFNALREMQNASRAVREAFDYQKAILENYDKALKDKIKDFETLVDASTTQCTNTLKEARENCLKSFSTRRRKRDIWTDFYTSLQPLIRGAKGSVGAVCGIVTESVCKPYSLIGNLKEPIEKMSELPIEMTRVISQLPMQLLRQFTDVDGQLTRLKNFLMQSTLSQARQNIIRELEGYFKMYKRISAFSDNLSYYLYVIATFVVILSAYVYYFKYHRRLSFDNNYITNEFQKYDKERSEREGKAPIFPLRWPQEGEGYIMYSSLKLTPEEFKTLGFGLIKFLAIVLVVFVVHVLDWGFYVVIDTIRTKGEAKIELTSNFTIGYQVVGDGVVALLFKTIIQGNNFTLSLTDKVETNQCLPQPKPPSGFDVAKSVIVLIFLGLLIAGQPHCVRARQWIAGYFYPERKRERFSYLYEKMQREREVIKLNVYESCLDINKENEEIEKGIKENSVFVSALRMFGLSRRHCIVCQERESIVLRKQFRRYVMKDGSQEYHNCPKCPAFYCHLCWEKEVVCHFCDNPIA